MKHSELKKEALKAIRKYIDSLYMLGEYDRFKEIDWAEAIYNKLEKAKINE